MSPSWNRVAAIVFFTRDTYFLSKGFQTGIYQTFLVVKRSYIKKIKFDLNSPQQQSGKNNSKKQNAKRKPKQNKKPKTNKKQAYLLNE